MEDSDRPSPASKVQQALRLGDPEGAMLEDMELAWGWAIQEAEEEEEDA